jgi:hypothetical protein
MAESVEETQIEYKVISETSLPTFYRYIKEHYKQGYRLVGGIYILPSHSNSLMVGGGKSFYQAMMKIEPYKKTTMDTEKERLEKEKERKEEERLEKERLEEVRLEKERLEEVRQLKEKQDKELIEKTVNAISHKFQPAVRHSLRERGMVGGSYKKKTKKLPNNHN